MSLSKMCFFTMLLVIAAVAMVAMLDLQRRDVLPSNFLPHAPAVVPEKSLPRTGSAANDVLVRSKWVLHSQREYSSDIFLPVQSKNPKDVSAGKLLVASRGLPDPDFAETVILLVHCDADGVVGLILNRRTNVPLSQVLDRLDAAKGRSDLVYLGGPVEAQAVLALLRSTTKVDGAQQIPGGMYFISAKTPFEKALSDKPSAHIFHVYLGYAGWSNEQLRREIDIGSWFIFQGDTATVFDADPDTLWEQMIRKTEFQFAKSGPARAPSQASIPAVAN